jgi:hypothetical protein
MTSNLRSTKGNTDMSSADGREVTVGKLERVSGGFELIELLVVIPK